MKNLLTVILAAMMLLSISCASMAPAPDITGTWAMNVQTDAGAGNPTFMLTQDGETITGKYSGALGESPVTGTIQDGNVELVISMSGMGMEMKIKYNGILQEDGSLKGTVEMGDFGKGTFTGKMQ